MNRRTFLKLSGVVTVGAALPAALGPDTRKAEKPADHVEQLPPGIRSNQEVAGENNIVLVYTASGTVLVAGIEITAVGKKGKRGSRVDMFPSGATLALNSGDTLEVTYHQGENEIGLWIPDGWALRVIEA